MANHLEHAEHVAHAGGHGHGHDDPNKALGMYIGITMAILGVLLALCAAQVGGERTELVQTLVERSNAQQQYHAQDVKHRVAFLQLQQIHALLGGGAQPDKTDVAMMARTVDRYLDESHLAKSWSESYEPAIKAHVKAQEHYDWAQLFAEIGVVVASVALLIKKRTVWFIAIALGVVAIGLVGTTFVQTRGVVTRSDTKIEETGKEYLDARAAHKTTDAEAKVVKAMLDYAGVKE